jgi:enterochelin esterase family protein
VAERTRSVVSGIGLAFCLSSPAHAQSLVASSPDVTARLNPPAGIAAGRLESLVVFDSVYRRERRLWVYTPPGYVALGHAPYDLIVAFDGNDYRDAVPLPMILDTLLAGAHAPAFVAVMVDNSTARIGDLANQPKFSQYLGRQLMPWLRRNYNVTRDAHRTIVTGSSTGGLAAAYVALQRPDLFGNVLAQSGAFWRGDRGANGAPFETLTAKYASTPRQDLRFVLDVGTQETGRVLGGTGPVFIDAVRRMRDALRGRGYPVTYTEVPAGVHAPATWSARLPVGIATLSKNWKKR